MIFYNGVDIERGPSSISNNSSDKRTIVSRGQINKKKVVTHLLSNLFSSNLLPPTINLLETEKLILTALKCQPKDIPEEVKTALLDILKYNHELKKKDVNKDAKSFLNWIKMVLSKIEQEKLDSEKLHINRTQHPSKEEERVKGGKLTVSKKQFLKKKEITLSTGIREAISKTVGEIEPKLLCNFLNHVRGRKKCLEVASVFTKNISGLASQLLEVINTYYKYVERRGPEEDRDIVFINRLHNRLLQHSKIMTQTSSDDKEDIIEDNFKTESDLPEVPIKTEPCMNEMAVKTELDVLEPVLKSEKDIAKVNFKAKCDVIETSVKIEPGITRMSVKTELDMSEMSVKTESSTAEMAVEPHLGILGHVKSEADITRISIKKEEVFMRQSSDYGNSLNGNLSSNGLYGASYFTNITQIPFSFTPVKTEVNDSE